MITEPMTVEQRVAAGAAWLDTNRPGWSELVDPATLNINDGCLCVLGQVYGHYFQSPNDARWADKERDQYLADVYGFNGDPREMQALNAAWRTLLAARAGVR